MLYSEKLNQFKQDFPAKTITVDGAEFRYVLCGKDAGRTLVLLNGGMNTLEMWMDYAQELSKDERVLLFDYPQALRTNGELITGMHAFFARVGVKNPIFVGASDGGMVAQLYTQKYPREVGGLVLISTGGMDEKTIRTLKKQYRFGLLMLWYMKQTPVTEKDFAALSGEILLILPEQDFFSAEMQKSLTELMHEPEIVCVPGGHLGTVLQAEAYIRVIRDFLKKQ